MKEKFGNSQGQTRERMYSGQRREEAPCTAAGGAECRELVRLQALLSRGAAILELWFPADYPHVFPACRWQLGDHRATEAALC